jgi:DNA-binding Lrp family transcriptional regulator
MSNWTFITRHGLVLAAIAKNPEKTAREIGDDVGVTERTAHKIINELEEEGYITKKKVGTRNTYSIHPSVPLKTGEAAVGELLVMLGWKHDNGRRTKPRPRS